MLKHLLLFRHKRLLLLSSLMTTAAVCHAQPGRLPRATDSENGLFTLRIERGSLADNAPRNASATLLERSPDTHREQVRWQADLVNEVCPVYVFVRNDGRFVVTLDEFRFGGARHALVIYGEEGQLLREFELPELLNHTDSGAVRERGRALEWLRGAECRFSDDGRQFVVRLRTDRTVRVDLETVEIVPGGLPELAAGENPFAPPFDEMSAADPEGGEPAALLLDEFMELFAAFLENGGEPTDEAIAALFEQAEANLSGDPTGDAMTPEAVDGAANQALALTGDVRPADAEEGDGAPADPEVQGLIDEAAGAGTVAGNSHAVGVPVPMPNPDDPVDYLAWINAGTRTEGPSAAVMYDAAIAAMVAPTFDTELFGAAMAGDPAALNSPEVLAWLEANQDAIDHYRTATQMAYRGRERTSEDGMLLSILLPELSSERQIAKTMTIAGKRLELEGRSEEAAGLYSDMIASGAQISQGPTLIENLVGVAIQHLGSQSLLDSLASAPDGAVDYAAVAEQLERSYRPTRAMAETIQYERMFLLDIAQRVFSWNEAAQRYMVDAQGLKTMNSVLSLTGESGADGLGLALALGSLDYEKTVATANAHYDVMTNAFRAPYPESRMMLQDLETRLEQERKWSPFGGNVLIATMMPALSRAHTIEVRNETNRRATLLSARIKAFEQSRGRLPESLSELQANAYATDPFTEQPFVYERTDDGFKLYSLGVNGTDEGGATADRWEDADLVYWPRPPRD